MGKLERISFRQAQPSVSAVGFLYKLCGSSQPSILKGSDGRFYVVKFNSFPGSRGLANEAIGAELIRRAGLPAPDWVPMRVSGEFLERHPGLWFSAGGSVIRPQAGLHFASRLVEAKGEARTYQMIPHVWIGRVQNRADFLGMLALDLWANQCDRRQAVFLSRPRGLYASFIDNDHLFGGQSGDDITCPRRAMAHDLDIYRGLWNEKILQEWLTKLGEIDENCIYQILRTVPEEWADAKARRDISRQLETRRGQLPRLLDEARDVLQSGYSIRYHRSRNATEPGQFRDAAILPVPQ